MDMDEAAILNLPADHFKQKFYKFVAEKMAADFFNLGLELEIDSDLLDAWRKDLQGGTVGNAQEIATRVVFKYRNTPGNKLKVLHTALLKLRGRLAQDLVSKARIYIEDNMSTGPVEVTDAIDGITRPLPDVPTENNIQAPEQAVPEVDTQPVAPVANQSAAAPVIMPTPPVAVVNPMETSQPSNGEASRPVATGADTVDTAESGSEPSRPDLFRLPSNQNPDDSLDFLR